MELGKVLRGAARPGSLKEITDLQVDGHQQSIPDQFAESRPRPVGVVGG